MLWGFPLSFYLFIFKWCSANGVVGQHLDFPKGIFQKRNLFIPERLGQFLTLLLQCSFQQGGGIVPAVVVALHGIQANVSSEFAWDDLFISFRLWSRCCWQRFAVRLTYPGVAEGEAEPVRISCQFSEMQNLPWAVKGSGADSAAFARGNSWKQTDFDMSL